MVLSLITPRCVLALVGEPAGVGRLWREEGRWELGDGKSLGEGGQQALEDGEVPGGRSAGGDLEGLVEAGARLGILRKRAPVPRILGPQVWAPSTQIRRT